MTFSATRIHQDGTVVNLRMVPGLNISALQQKKDKPLFLYYCLRALDVDGVGKLEKKPAIAALVAQFGYTRQTAGKHLQEGTGLFWRVHQCRDGRELIIYHSIIRVIKDLGADCRADKYVGVSSVPPSNRLQERRALLYNVGTYQNLRAPISRKSLEEKSGLSGRLQRTYDRTLEKNGHQIRTRNLGYRKQNNRISLNAREVDTGFFTAQLPNTYTAIHTGQHRGLLRRAQSSNRGEATTPSIRRYFKPRDFVRAVKRGLDHGYVLESGRWVYQFA